MGKFFGSKIHLFKAPEKDPGLAKKINVNLNFAVRYLVQNNIAYEVHTANSKSQFAEETISFSQQINADLIIIMTTKNIGLTDYIFGTDEQTIIANNAKIPVMVVNPREHASQGLIYLS